MQKTQRSSFVTVLAWIFIILSGFSTFISVVQNIVIQIMLRNSEYQVLLQELPQDAPPIVAFMMGHFHLIFLAFLLLAVFALVTSIGLLKRWNWARLCFVGSMVLAIVWNFVNLGLMFFMLKDVSTANGGLDMHIAFAVAMVIFSLGLSILFGWIIKKLLSAPISEEFR